jgi:hypothetical protein
MTTIIRETLTSELELEVLGAKAKRELKKALVKVFGKEQGEYLADYGMVNTGNSAYILLQEKDAYLVREAL